MSETIFLIFRILAVRFEGLGLLKPHLLLVSDYRNFVAHC